MVSGTFVLTDQITSAFTTVFRDANGGSDAIVTGHPAFGATADGDFHADGPPLPVATLDAVRRVPGVARAEGQVWTYGALVRHGKIVGGNGGPHFVFSRLGGGLDPTRLSTGRYPSASGELAVNEKLFRDEHLRVGERVAVTTPTDPRQVRLVGAFRFGRVASIGDATMLALPLADVQRWYEREGRLSTVVVKAEAGIGQPELARRVRAALPARTADVATARADADAQARSINDAFINTFLRTACSPSRASRSWSARS